MINRWGWTSQDFDFKLQRALKLQAAQIEALHQQLRARRSRLKKQTWVQMSPDCCLQFGQCGITTRSAGLLTLARRHAAAGPGHCVRLLNGPLSLSAWPEADLIFSRHVSFDICSGCTERNPAETNPPFFFFLKRIHIVSTKCNFCQWVQKNWTVRSQHSWVVFVLKLWCEEIPTLIWRREWRVCSPSTEF